LGLRDYYKKVIRIFLTHRSYINYNYVYEYRKVESHRSYRTVGIYRTVAFDWNTRGVGSRSEVCGGTSGVEFEGTVCGDFDSGIGTAGDSGSWTD
jgi:hypothetical protein